MFKVEMPTEVFTNFVTRGRPFSPAIVAKGLPEGCQMYRCFINMNSKIECYFLDTEEVMMVQSGKHFDIAQRMETAKSVDVAIVAAVEQFLASWCSQTGATITLPETEDDRQDSSGSGIEGACGENPQEPEHEESQIIQELG